MNGFWGSGFITQIIYAASTDAASDTYSILTEDNQNLLTENSQNIDIEHL